MTLPQFLTDGARGNANGSLAIPMQSAGAVSRFRSML